MNHDYYTLIFDLQEHPEKDDDRKARAFGAYLLERKWYVVIIMLVERQINDLGSQNFEFYFPTD